MNPYQANIYKLYLIKTAKWFMLTMPIIALFYQENGMGMQEVLLLQGIYSVAMVSLEIPSGYFADLWGRKATMIIGAVLGALGFAVYSLSSGFWYFLMAEIILGIGQSFISGSDSALLYDSLLAMKKEKSYLKLEGRVMSVGNFAETIATVIGGLLAEMSLRTPFVAQTFVACIAIPAAITLIEPPTQKLSDTSSKWKAILKVLSHTLLTNPSIRALILFTAFIGTGTLSMAWFVQPYLKEVHHLSYAQIGIALAVLNLLVGVFTWVAYKIEAVLGKKKTLLLILLGISIPYILISQITHWAVLLIVSFFYMIRGIATPVLKDYINRQTNSEVRATVLSIRNFAIRIIFAIIAPFLGWYSDLYTVSQAMLITGVIIFFFALISFVLLLNKSY